MKLHYIPVEARSKNAQNMIEKASNSVAEWMATVNKLRWDKFASAESIYDVEPIQHAPEFAENAHIDSQSTFDIETFGYWDEGMKAVALGEAQVDEIESSPEFSTDVSETRRQSLKQFTKPLRSSIHQGRGILEVEFQHGTTFEFTINADEDELRDIYAVMNGTTFLTNQDGRLYYVLGVDERLEYANGVEPKRAVAQLSTLRDKGLTSDYRQQVGETLLKLFTRAQNYTVPFLVAMRCRTAGRVAVRPDALTEELLNEVRTALDVEVVEQGQSLIFTTPKEQPQIQQSVDEVQQYKPSDAEYKRKMGKLLGYPSDSVDLFASSGSFYNNRYWLSLAFDAVSGSPRSDLKYVQLAPFKPAPGDLDACINTGKQYEIALRQFAVTYSLPELHRRVQQHVHEYPWKTVSLSMFEPVHSVVRHE